MSYIFREGMFNKAINYIDNKGIHIGNSIILFKDVIGIKFRYFDNDTGSFTFALIGNVKKELMFGKDKKNVAQDAYKYLLNATELENEENAYLFFQHEIDHPYRDEKSLKKVSEGTKDDEVARCPKCNSSSVGTTNKKISLGRAAVGAIVGSVTFGVGTAGAAVGAVTSKKNLCICMKCGHKWKI